MIPLAVGVGVLLVVAAGLLALALHAVDQWTRPARVRPSRHPRDFGLPWEDVTFKSRDGMTLRGWFIAPTAPAPARALSLSNGSLSKGRAAVIFCHGHGGDKSPDLIYAPWFYEQGLPVLLFDFRNHGESEGTLTSLGYYERNDLLGAVDLLRARGYERVGLFGFSMGGAISIATAPLSDAVACVVADSPFAELEPTLAMALRRRGFPRWFAVPMTRVVFWLGARRLGCDPREAYPAKAARVFGGRPLLLILGERDEYIELWQGRLLYERASGPKELWLVPGAGHRRSDQVEPERYREKVMGFFARVL
ncbi:MAG: alpha/beta hydrolase [Chloroflexi bacterium]|nr:alpha/beta hydrolase [Chloroflexota bacterium]